MDNQETREVTNTYADGSTVTMTIDCKTGALLDYNATPPPPRTTGDGLQALAKRVETLEQSRTSDIADVVRKAEIFSEEHTTILPELLPDPEIKWIKGVGRPDKPETTEGAIVGDEEDCTRYLSTDGAGVGAWEWEKRGGVWHVVRGDTGWRAIKFPKDSAVTNKESFFLLRRVGDTVFAAVGGDTDKGWSVPTIMLDKEVRGLIWLPRGFVACNQIFTPFTADVKGVAKGLVDTIGVIINVYPDSQTSHNHSYECLLQVRLRTDVWNSGVTLCRGFIPEFNYSTVEPWPDTLPGDSFGICYV
jgi:hypothetical protein|nr:MAG TPA: hypothetical protein [Caudoviricetes sp.]